MAKKSKPKKEKALAVIDYAWVARNGNVNIPVPNAEKIDLKEGGTVVFMSTGRGIFFVLAAGAYTTIRRGDA